MNAIKSLTFTIGDMKADACKQLENCMGYLAAGSDLDKVQAAICFGRAAVWLDNLSDIGIELADEDEHVETMLEIAEQNGFEC